jgi:hypothetical protein
MDRLRQFWIASVGVCHSRCWHRRLQNCSPGNTKVRCRLYPPPTSKTSLSESLPFAAKYKYMSGGSFSAIPVTYTMYVCMYGCIALHSPGPGYSRGVLDPRKHDSRTIAIAAGLVPVDPSLPLLLPIGNVLSSSQHNAFLMLLLFGCGTTHTHNTRIVSAPSVGFPCCTCLHYPQPEISNKHEAFLLRRNFAHAIANRSDVYV